LWKIRPAGLIFDLARLQDFLVLGRGDTPLLRNLVFGDMYVVPISAAAPTAIAAPPALNPIPLAWALDGGAYDAVVLAVDGAITGMKTGGPEGDRLETMPGTTLYTFAPDEKIPAQAPVFRKEPGRVNLMLSEELAARLGRELKITAPRDRLERGETVYKTLGGGAGSPVPFSADATVPGGGHTEPPPVITVGAVFKGGALAGAIIGPGVTYQPPLGAVPVTRSPRNEPARFDGGYVVLPPAGPVYFGGPAYSGGQPMRAEGRAFRPGYDVAIELNGRRVQTGIRPDAQGRFVAVVSLRGLLPGMHQLVVRQDLGDGTEDTDVRGFMIRPDDRTNQPR
jgi:hypothetical protein